MCKALNIVGLHSTISLNVFNITIYIDNRLRYVCISKEAYNTFVLKYFAVDEDNKLPMVVEPFI